MFKLLTVCAALLVAAQALSIGGFQPEAGITDEVLDLARWSASQMSAYTNLEGEHNLMTVRNLRTQVVSGINYFFTIDLLVQTPENKYFFRSCDLAVYVQSWTNTKRIIGVPQCGANPSYPN